MDGKNYSYSAKNFRQELKKRGAFYTPPEMAEYMRKLLPDDVDEIYDPTCGNGGLLSVYGDDVQKYGQDFAVQLVDYGQIKRGDLIIQYFSCPACCAKYHVCTTDSKMRQLIKRRLEIQGRIAEACADPVSTRKAHRLQKCLDGLLRKQAELMPRLRQKGLRILESHDEY